MSTALRSYLLLLALGACGSNPSASAQGVVFPPSDECANWQTAHPEWIFCDDFEADGPLVATGRYFEYGDDDGDFVVRDSAGVGGSRGMRTRFEVGEVSAGGFKLGFGRNPNAYMNRGIRGDKDFRAVYYRMYLKHEEGWRGSPAKLSRATVFTSATDWSQAMIAHLWSDDAGHLLIDPASCVRGDSVACVGYNDFDSLRWLGYRAGSTVIFSTADSGTWQIGRAHV